MSRNRQGTRKYGNKTDKSKDKDKKVEVNVPMDDVNPADTRDLNSSSRSRRKGKSTSNDKSWYNRIKPLSDAAANYPFGAPIGSRLLASNSFKTYKMGTQDITMQSSLESVPGICVINYVPTIGGTEDQATAPVNMAAMQLFAYQRSKNSRSASYDAPNLMMYFMAMRSVYALYASLVRVYGSLNLSTPFGRYMPQALVRAQGFDYDDLTKNMAAFHYTINQFAYKLGQLNVPAGMSIIDRNVWMNTGYYLDSQSVKAQMYLYRQEGYHRYTEAVEGPSFLQYKPLTQYVSGDNGLTYEDINTLITDFLQPLLESEDLGTISADIIKAYGLENCITIAPIASNYATLPEYNPEVLTQIENTVLTGTIDTGIGSTDMDIIEIIPANELGSPYLEQNTYTMPYEINNSLNGKSFVAAAYTGDFILNFHTQNTDPDSVMVATRLTNIPTHLTNMFVENESPVIEWGVCGSELATTAQIFYFYDKPGGSWDLGNTPMITSNVGALWSASLDAQNVSNVINLISKFVCFDWAPRMSVITMADTNLPTNVAPIFDVDYYTTLNLSDLKRMHEAAITSEFVIAKIDSLAKSPRK